VNGCTDPLESIRPTRSAPEPFDPIGGRSTVGSRPEQISLRPRRHRHRKVAQPTLRYLRCIVWASSWPSPTPAITAMSWPNTHATKLRVAITPRSENPADCDRAFKFRIQKATFVLVGRGSDEPTFKVTWRTLKGTYRTNAHDWPKTKTVNLKKGTYRAVVKARCGYAGVASNAAPVDK
jgi:hypothetical protein